MPLALCAARVGVERGARSRTANVAAHAWRPRATVTAVRVRYHRLLSLFEALKCKGSAVASSAVPHTQVFHRNAEELVRLHLVSRVPQQYEAQHSALVLLSIRTRVKYKNPQVFSIPRGCTGSTNTPKTSGTGSTRLWTPNNVIGGWSVIAR